jgi:lipopolysaccharide export system permease protein
VIISRYLVREVLMAMVMITGVLLLAFLSQQIVRYLNYAAIGKIPTSIMLQLVSFEVPYLLSFLLPLGFYLGILLAYGRLYADNEMAILQLAGFGERRLLRLTLIAGLFITAFVLFLMLSVNPALSAKRQLLMESDEATLHLIQTLIPGRFQVSPDGQHVMYVEKLSRNHSRAENVFLAQEKKSKETEVEPGNEWMLVFADQGYEEKDKQSGDQFFVTTDGYRYEGTPGHNDYKIVQFKKYTVRIAQPDTRVLRDEAAVLSAGQLLQNYHDPSRAAELQWRISVALSALLLVLIAVPLSHVKPRRGRYLMLLPAILIYIVYINLLFIARHWVERGIVPISIGMWWVHALMLILAFGLLMGTRFNANFKAR